ncbi:MAG: CDP-glucose 4,6-dehydratase [Ignavibacteria bacterium]
MELKNSFGKTFSGKKVFVTGHTGFKGSWLTLWLETIGADVKGYSLKPDQTSLFNRISKDLKCRSVFGDINDQKKLENEIVKFQPDFIFHLAAQSLVRRSYRLPLYTFQTNILGTANLLQSLTKLKKKCTAIIVTTDKVYENKEWIYPYREIDRLGGHDPYSSSKACAEIVTASFVNSFFPQHKFNIHKKSVSTVRAGNVIGGGDYSEDRLIPDIVKAIIKNKTVVIRNPDSVRPWQYVLEPLSGYLLLASLMSKDPLKYSGAYNFGPGDEAELNVRSIVDIAVKTFGKGNYTISRNKNEPHEAKTLRLDISKSRELLRWQPALSTSEAIQRTIGWYKNSVARNVDAFRLCLNEISEFEKKR